MTINFRGSDVAASELTEALLAPPTAESTGGDIAVRSKVYFSSDGITSGVWESEPGESRWQFLDRGEVVTILTGTLTVHEDGDQPVTLSAGDSAIFPLGWTGTWVVHEKVRKIFVVYRPGLSQV